MLRLTRTRLSNGFCKVRRIGRRTQQMHGFHQAAVMIERHDYRIWGVATRNDRDVCILNHLIDKRT